MGTGHKISLEDRERLSVTGVTEVAEFNEDGITADTERGAVTIKGEELHVTRLDIEEGILDIEGRIESIEYSDKMAGKISQSFLNRIFR